MSNPDNSEKKNPLQSSKTGSKFSPADLLSFFKKLSSPSQNVIGIDIGSSYVKILQLEKARKGYLISACSTRAIPANLKEDAAEKKRFIQAIVKEFIQDAKKKSRLGRIALSGKGIFVFSLTVPAISKKDLKGLVSIELKKRLPYQLDINNMSFDFFITGQVQDEKGQSLQVTCIAADRVTVDEQTQFLKEMDINPVAINVSSDALGNILPYCIEKVADKTIALLDMGANVSLLNFYKGKNLVFFREIPVGGEHFTRAMAKTIASSSGTLDLSVEDAEKIKRNCGIPLEDEARVEFLTDFGVLLGEQISALLRPSLERLILEINRTISYYTKTFKTDSVDELYITGGSSRLKNIDKFFLYNLERLKKVERLDVLKAVKGWSEMGGFRQELVVEQAAPHLAVAFGLCLGEGGRVNLLSVKEKLEQKTVIIASLFKIIFPIIFCLFVAWYGFSLANNLNYNRLIKRIEQQINQLQPTADKVKEYLNMKTRLDDRKELLEKAKGKQPLWWGVFKELSNITPQEVIIKKIITVSNKEQKEIHILGRIMAKYTNIDVALSQYLMNLDESPFFTNVEMVSSDKDMYSLVPAANFEIVCKLVY